MALSSSKSSSNRLWRKHLCLLIQTSFPCLLLFFAASIGGRQIINSKCCGGDTAYRLFWKKWTESSYCTLHLQKKTSGIQKLQRTNNCKESPQWHKGQTSQSRIPKALLQLGMQALIGVRCNGNLPQQGKLYYLNSGQVKLSTWFVWWLPEGTVIHPTKMNHQHGFLIQWEALFLEQTCKRIKRIKGCRCLYLPWWYWRKFQAFRSNQPATKTTPNIQIIV